MFTKCVSWKIGYACARTAFKKRVVLPELGVGLIFVLSMTLRTSAVQGLPFFGFMVLFVDIWLGFMDDRPVTKPVPTQRGTNITKPRHKSMPPDCDWNR